MQEPRGDLHLLGDNLACRGPKKVKVCIPKLIQSLVLEPALDDQETVDHARSVVGPAGFLCGLDHLCSNDPAVRLRYLFFIQLARYGFFYEVSQAESDFGNVGRGDGRLNVGIVILRQDCGSLVRLFMSAEEQRSGAIAGAADAMAEGLHTALLTSSTGLIHGPFPMFVARVLVPAQQAGEAESRPRHGVEPEAITKR